MSLFRSVENRIAGANEILEKLSHLEIEGVAKLTNKFKQEISFLQKCIYKRRIKFEHLMCSNLTHLEAVAKQLLRYQDICHSVMAQKTLKYEDGSYKKICIDLILCGGSVWMKVIARNRRALALASKGQCSFGQKNVIDQANEFLLCSKQNVCFFHPPIITFFFANGVDDVLAIELIRRGLRVEQFLPDTCVDPSLSPRENSQDHEKPRVEDLHTMHDVEILNRLGVTRLNLGVTAMIAYVSALTNGGCNKNFRSEILKQHAEWERLRPVKPILDKLFEGKILYSCRTAVKDFKEILRILGGDGERERGTALLEKVIIVDDHPTPHLTPGGKIKERSIAIFGTGEYLRAVTVTANNAFVRSAKNRGVTFEVFLHESRALTEGKELP